MKKYKEDECDWGSECDEIGEHFTQINRTLCKEHQKTYKVLYQKELK